MTGIWNAGWASLTGYRVFRILLNLDSIIDTKDRILILVVSRVTPDCRCMSMHCLRSMRSIMLH